LRVKIISLVSIIFLVPLILASDVPTVLASLPQQSTPEPEYLTPQLMVEANVALDKCFVGYISSGMVPCDAPPGTDAMHIDDVWPQTVF